MKLVFIVNFFSEFYELRSLSLKNLKIIGKSIAFRAHTATTVFISQCGLWFLFFVVVGFLF